MDSRKISVLQNNDNLVTGFVPKGNGAFGALRLKLWRTRD